MLWIYDLYDLHRIFANIRFSPDYKLNGDVLSKVINVLENRHNDHDLNQFRRALQKINSLDKKLYGFSFVENEYTYFPSGLKSENTYIILIKSCEYLLKAIKEGNKDKIIDLADCLHNLPTMIAEHHLTIPDFFWKREVRHYREKWDKGFLKDY